jgi:hypothetical protein
VRSVEFEGVPFEEEAAQVILDFLSPDQQLGWEGVPWFGFENAKELVGYLWEQGFVIRKAVRNRESNPEPMTKPIAQAADALDCSLISRELR